MAQCFGQRLRFAVEASGRLVGPAVFNTDVIEYLGQAGSIPVRLRQPTSRFDHRTRGMGAP